MRNGFEVIYQKMKIIKFVQKVLTITYMFNFAFEMNFIG